MDVIMDNCCHAHVIPDNCIASNRESASKLKVNLHRCTRAEDRPEFSAFAGGPSRNAALAGIIIHRLSRWLHSRQPRCRAQDFTESSHEAIDTCRHGNPLRIDTYLLGNGDTGTIDTNLPPGTRPNPLGMTIHGWLSCLHRVPCGVARCSVKGLGRGKVRLSGWLRQAQTAARWHAQALILTCAHTRFVSYCTVLLRAEVTRCARPQSC